MAKIGSAEAVYSSAPSKKEIKRKEAEEVVYTPLSKEEVGNQIQRDIAGKINHRFTPDFSKTNVAETIVETKKPELKTTIPSRTYDESYVKELQLKNNMNAAKREYEETKANDDRNILVKFLQMGSDLSPVYYTKTRYDKAKKDYEDFKSAKYYSSLPNGTVKSTNPDKDFFKANDSIDMKYEYINDINNARDFVRTTSSATGSKNAYKIYDNMTDREIGIYNYLYETEGKNKAEEFLKFLETDLDALLNQDVAKFNKQFAEKFPILSSAASVAGTFASVGEQLKNYGEYLATGNMKTNKMSTATSTIRDTVSEKVDLEIGNWDAFDFVYNTVMSGVDSFVAASSGPLGAVALGLSAAGSTTNDILARGGDSSQAFWGGAAAGVFEGFFEKFSIGQLNAMQEGAVKGFKDYALNLVKSMGVNFSEEAATEVANILYDYAINGGISNYSIMVQEFIDDGVPLEIAKKKAAQKLGMQVLEAGASGALMGFGFASISSAASYKNASSIGKMIAANESESEVLNAALSMDGNTESYKMASEIKNSGEITTAKMGGLVSQIMSDISNQKSVAIETAVSERAKELGIDSKTKQKLTSYLTKAATNGKIETIEADAIGKNAKAQQIINEIKNNDVWAQSMNSQLSALEKTENTVRSAITLNTPESAVQSTPTTESEVESGVTPVEQSGEVLETPVVSQQERETVFTEPTNQEIYRDPTDEENAEAIFGKRKSAKQRHIIDVAKKLDSNMKVVFVDKNSKSLNGKNGKYNRDTNTMYIAKDLETNDIKLVEAYVEVFKHEFVHRLELRKAYKSFKDYLFNKSVAFEKYAKARLALLDIQEGRGKNVERAREDAINDLIDMYMKNVKSDQTLTQEFRDNFTREKAEREAVADFVARTLFKEKSADFLMAVEDKNIYDKENGTGFAQMETDLEFFEEMASTDRNLLQKIIDAIRDLINSIKGITNLEKDLQYIEERLTRVYQSADNKKAATESGEVYKNANVSAETVQSLNEEGLEYDADSESLYSADSWESSEYVKDRKGTAKKISEAIGVSERKALQYIKDIDSIANKVLSNYARLGYVPSPDRSAFVSNAEYGGSIDMSTLCAKRRWLTGTFSAIQKALNHTALTANEILEIRNMLKEKGIEVSCGLCYVEGSRAQMGKFAKEFIERYKKRDPDWVPDMSDVNTPEGVEQMRMEHPEAYEAYEKFWNNKGVLNEGEKVLFASQQKPKLYQLRTDYKHEILDKFSSEGNVVEKNKNGGLRIQSFSDFEIVHLIDMMQVIIDMSRVGLNGQAYTKVPEFALALGNTGLKINLSLIAKDVDAEGNLVFDDVEGMPFETAMNIRNMYSKNVGTVLVVFNDAQLMAALKDSRIDFVLPFHRSQWKKAMYEQLGLPTNTKDYTYVQNEKYIKPVYYTTRKGTIGKRKATNYMPNQYWDFNISGKENAEKYLKMCAEENKRPKFYKFLDDNGDGSYSLKKDGSTDGYWKLLIDFKMYDNDGKGSKQTAVKPDFNMEECHKMLDEYQGEHQKFPVDQEVVDKFVSNYVKKRGEQGFKDTAKSEAKAPDTKYDNFSYSSDDLSTLQRNLYNRHKNGEITNEEYLEKTDELWENAKEEYGTLPQGEKAKVAANVPAAVSEDKPTERFIRTIIETDTLNGDMLKGMQESTLLGDFSYKVISDESAIKKADKAMENGTANDVWEETINSPRITKNEIAIGEQLLKEAIEKGDTVKVLKLSAELADVFTRAGQTVQAAQLFKKMTGPGRLVSLQRTVKTLNKDLRAKYGVEYPPIKIREETAKRLVEAETLNGIEYAYQEALQEVANQMPSTFLDKWNAWRYFAMLSNPKTHIRNVVGNAIFVPVVRIKDFIGSITESGLEQGKKTKSILVKKEYRDFAKKDAKLDSVKNLLKGNKYNDKSAIREKQKVFKSEALNFLTEFNSNALEAEDMLFKNIHYIHALAGFLQVRNVNLKNVSQEVLEEARIYAVKEAKKATFNDESALANAIQRFGNKNLGTSILVEGVLPFKRTPINIVKRGIEYSPIGLAKTLTKGLYDVKKGKITMSEYIDGLASGLTGTGIMLVGMFLASLGCITGGEDDDKESEFEKWLGKQEYAVEVFGKSYTVDWAAPSNIPFFIGVEIVNTAKEGEDFSLSQLGNAVWNSLEPITNLSMLSGMQSVIESARYADSAQTLSAIAVDAITSYGMQAVPSLSGALARTIDPTQRSWYIDKNDKVLDSTAQTIKNNIQSKIPGLSYTQIPKIDIWGREVSRGGAAERVLENFVSPGYYSEIEVTETSEELKRIFNETDQDVFPNIAAKSFKVGDETKHLTAQEYVTYAKAKGSYSYDYIKEFMEATAYKKLTDKEKADVITKLYEYANAKAKTTVSNYDLMKNYKTVTQWEQNGRSAIDYYIFRAINK